MTSGPTPEQRAAIAATDRHVYVGAGPGTGKTYLLVERVRMLLDRGVAPERILVLTFSRRSARELRERITSARIAGAATVEVRTFHGFAARAAGAGLARFRELRLLDAFSRRIVLEAAIAKTATPTLAAPVCASQTFIDECARLLGDLARIDPAVFASIAPTASLRLRDVIAIMDMDARLRRIAGAGDLGDLVRGALTKGAQVGSAVQRWLAERFEHVLVDEFQDSDREQLALLELLGAQIFAVGDEAQSIYRFRGASDAIVPYAIDRFAMARYDLTESRRCPAPVCDLASLTPLPHLAPLRSAHTGDAEPVEVLRFGATDDEVIALADAIEVELDAGRSADEIAVLLRAFRPVGSLLCDELARRGIAVAAGGRAALLADPRIAALRSALAVFAAPHDAKRWCDLLAARPLGFDALAVRLAQSARADLRLDATLHHGLAPFTADASHAERLTTGLLEAYAAWQSGELGRAARLLVRRLGLLAAAVRDEAPADVRSAAERLKRVCDGLSAAQRTARALGVPSDPHAIFARLDDVLESLALDDSGVTEEATGVRILTIHAAKGLEFERVFIADAVQGRFPRTLRTLTLLDDADRALLATHGVDGLTVVPEGALREDASLWYVAVTRCKQKLTISFADRDSSANPQRPSSFITAHAPESITDVDRRPLLFRALGNRDAAINTDVAAALVAQAIPALTAFVREGSAAFDRCDTTGIRYARSFSVSNATTWLMCPRKVFYAKMLRLPDEPTSATEIGSILHSVLERFHERHPSFTGSAPDPDAVTDELHALRAELWVADRFAGAAISDAAARAADAALTAYARFLATYALQHPFTVERHEEKVQIPAGDHAIIGRLDRLDRLSDGTTAVIDYKKGSAKASPVKAVAKVIAQWTKDDAEGVPRKPLASNVGNDLDLQLAFYATALENVSALVKIYLGGAKDAHDRNGTAVEDFTRFDDALALVARAALDELGRDALAPLAAGTLATAHTATNSDACAFCAFTKICPGPAEGD